MQRILLPLFARALALGHAEAVPAGLFAVNLAALFAIGWLAMLLANARSLPLAIPAAIVAWPGFFVALTHDTTEILAAALILGAIAAWLARRTAIASILLTLATLTRETAILFAAGLLVASFLRAVRSPRNARQWREAAFVAASLLPFLIWRHVVATLWQDPPQAHGIAHNIGLPLLGLAQTILANISGHAIGLARIPGNLAKRLTALWSAAILIWFCIEAFRAAISIISRNDRALGLAAGWLLILCLMCLLTANGPWIEPAAWFRAFTECWLLGCILLGLARVRLPPPAWLAAAALPLLLRNFELCWLQVRVS
jgi:fluoride ion exporter CrcB/FEX